MEPTPIWTLQGIATKRPLAIGGDGRADSPGHSAYTVMELVVIDVQLVQRNEVKGSYHNKEGGPS